LARAVHRPAERTSVIAAYVDHERHAQALVDHERAGPVAGSVLRLGGGGERHARGNCQQCQDFHASPPVIDLIDMVLQAPRAKVMLTPSRGWSRGGAECCMARATGLSSRLRNAVIPAKAGTWFRTRGASRVRTGAAPVASRSRLSPG